MLQKNGSQYFYKLAISLNALSEDATKDNWAGVYQFLRVDDIHTENERLIFCHITTHAMLEVPTFVELQRTDANNKAA